MTAGQLLRSARGRHGLTQAQLAARAHLAGGLLDLMGERLSMASREEDYGFDRTLYDTTLAMTPDERLDHGVAFANFVRRNLGAASAR